MCVSGAPPPASPMACSQVGRRPARTSSALTPTASRPTSSRRGRRPVASRSSSATIRSLPDSSRSTVSVTGPPCTRPRPVSAAPARLASVIRVPRRTSTPAVRSASRTAAPANGSWSVSSASPRTSIVTLLPRARIHVAASQATTPPPTMTSRSGTSTTPVASRDPQACRSANIGGTTGTEPVASTRATPASTTVLAPPSELTLTVFSPMRRAWPRMTSRPAPVAQSSWEVSS